MEEVNLLPKFLTEKLNILGYKPLKVTSPTQNAYSVEITSINEPKAPKQQVFIKSIAADTSETSESYNFEADLYFANETLFYSQIVANYLRLQETFNAINVPFSSVPTATCLYADSSCLVLEDLYASGYHPVDIHAPLKLDHARVVLEALANFHAFAIALRHHQPEIFDDLHTKINPTGITDDTSRTIFIEGVKDALKLARTSFPRGSIYVDKLSYFILEVYKNYPPVGGASRRRFKGNKVGRTRVFDEEEEVLTHGDLWPNNILVKTVENNVEAVKFVDFQGCQLGSWVDDLMAVVLIALDKQTRDEHSGELFECYRNAVCLKLDELHVDGMRISQLFSPKSFAGQLRAMARHAMATAVAGLPLYMQENTDAPPTPLATGSDDQVVLYFRWLRERKSMKCKNKMLEIIMDVVDWGYLD